MDRTYENILGGSGGIFDPKSVSTPVLFTILLSLTVLVLLVVYLHHRYVRYKKERVFFEEMDMLELESTESSTLTDIVKRYSLNEPVQILYSLRLFDEMAEKEMERVLSKPLPINLKTQYVDVLYNIRQKTYFPEGVRQMTPAKITPDGTQNPESHEQIQEAASSTSFLNQTEPLS
jgi:hypothetical protein